MYASNNTVGFFGGAFLVEPIGCACAIWYKLFVAYGETVASKYADADSILRVCASSPEAITFTANVRSLLFRQAP